VYGKGSPLSCVATGKVRTRPTVRAAVKDFGWNYAPAVLTVHYNATRRGRGQDRSRTARPGASEARGNLRAEAGHAYTKALLGSIRKPDPRADPRSVLHGRFRAPSILPRDAASTHGAWSTSVMSAVRRIPRWVPSTMVRWLPATCTVKAARRARHSSAMAGEVVHSLWVTKDLVAAAGASTG
jgi:hypothetical protein